MDEYHKKLRRALRGMDQSLSDIKFSMAANPDEWSREMRKEMREFIERARDELQQLVDANADK